ncbi:MAG: hypothetical protein ACP5LP_02935 [Candidatus Micrarchaeia archaeon]
MHLCSLFPNSMLARRGRQTVSKLVNEASHKGFRKLLILKEAGRPEDIKIDIINVINAGDDYTRQTSLVIKDYNLKFVEGNSNDVIKKFKNLARE